MVEAISCPSWGPHTWTAMSETPPDADSFLIKYTEYLKLLARLQIDRRLQGKVDLSGIVQQTLLEGHLVREQLRPQATEQQLAWLRRALANNIADDCRRMRSDKRDVQREVNIEAALEASSIRLGGLLADEGSAPDARIERAERAVALATALARLPESQREALVMQHWEGLTLQEIAERMGTTRTAVAGLLKRGLRQLRDVLRDNCEPL
jgi:RNA polymerase sigma-70 factor (ECF subfamily)